MFKVVNVSKMQAIEKEANVNGLTYDMMMANAGLGLARVIENRYGDRSNKSALGLVGSGNNGGDTLVALTHLANNGWKTTAAIIRLRPLGDPLLNKFLEIGGQVFDAQTKMSFIQLGELVIQHAVILDGVLGTGIKLPLRGHLAGALDNIRKTISESKNPPAVIAVDCPSGVDCDNGEAAPECIPADLTVSMAAVKEGLLKFPAYRLIGEIEVVDIGPLDDGACSKSWQQVQTFIPDHNWVRKVLPPRPLDAHKGTFGTALIAAGSTNYTGAALLAGLAAYRSGVGLVTLAVPEVLHSALAGQLPEATWLLLPHEKGAISASASHVIRDHLKQVDALLFGCGVGLTETSRLFISQLLEEKQLPPLIIDADGLKLLSSLPDWHHRLPPLSVLTPHPGEMAHLTGKSTIEIQSSRLETARNFSQLWGQVVVLKGAITVISEPSGQTAVIPIASPALARAGTGDVLAGLIAGLRAQGVGPFEAAAAGAWIHANAGLKAACSLGSTTCVLASDVLRGCIQVIAELS